MSTPEDNKNFLEEDIINTKEKSDTIEKFDRI